MVRFHPGSMSWSVGVSAAHLLGKQGDRVQFPDRPWVGGMSSTANMNPGHCVRLLKDTGCWSNGTTPALQAGNRGSTPRRSTDVRAHGPTGRHRPGVAEIRVRFSVSPLLTEGIRIGSGNWLLTSRPSWGWGFNSPTFRLSLASMVKWKSCLASNEVFRVQLLVGVLLRTLSRCLWCSGFCTAGCEPDGGGSTPLRHPYVGGYSPW